MCDCEFTPYPPGDEMHGEESWHYLRKCACGVSWFSLHCGHDGVQGKCPGCGERGVSIRTQRDSPGCRPSASPDQHGA